MIRNFQSGVLYLWAGIVYRSFIGIYKYIISYRSGPLQDNYSATYVPTQRSSRLSPTFWSVVFLRWKLRTPTYTTIGPLLGIDWKHTILFWKEYTKYTLNIVQCQRRSICIHCAGGVMSNLFPCLKGNHWILSKYVLCWWNWRSLFSAGHKCWRLLH